MSTGGKSSGRKEHLRRGLVGVLLLRRFSPIGWLEPLPSFITGLIIPRLE